MLQQATAGMSTRKGATRRALAEPLFAEPALEEFLTFEPLTDAIDDVVEAAPTEVPVIGAGRRTAFCSSAPPSLA
jgi:hypothetical protein